MLFHANYNFFPYHCCRNTVSTTIDVFLPAKLFIVQGQQSIWFDRNATKIDRLAPYYVFH